MIYRANQGISVGGTTNRNFVTNPNFKVNQRNLSGTVTLTAGQGGHDRWKAGASGCTYTFALTGNVTTITISAGTLLQVISGEDLPVNACACVLSWGGSALCRINNGSYGSGQVQYTTAGGVGLSIEFGIGTVGLVQFERGTVATVMEQRALEDEIDLCKKYLEIIRCAAHQFVATGTSNTATAYFHINYTPKRALPTITVSSGFTLFNGVSQPVGTFVSAVGGLTSGRLDFTGLSASNGLSVVLITDATAGRTITISAEL